jgi:hypothetical protein
MIFTINFILEPAVMYISNSFNKTDDENIVAKTISQMVPITVNGDGMPLLYCYINSCAYVFNQYSGALRKVFRSLDRRFQQQCKFPNKSAADGDETIHVLTK